MIKSEAKKRIEKLKKVINYHRYLYHVLDKPEISDAALDSLKHELSELEQKFPEFITSDSPSQRVGGKPLEKFDKVGHRTPMLSLNDAFDFEEIKQWQQRIKKLTKKKIDYFCELKIDGFAISLIYKNGIFVQGSTRGDGRIGEDVSQNLKTIESIPLRLEKDISCEVRGEVYMTKKAFEKVNRERKNNGLSLYANPRNTAAGSIRQLDPKIAAGRELNFLAYDLVTDLGQKTHQQKHQLIKGLGFKTDEGRYCRDLSGVMDFYNEVQSKREKLPYQIDGLVNNVNNNKLFEELGVVGKAPRGAIAFKFPAKQATTIVEDIRVQIGRTGILTPVAYLRPIRLDGTTISRATLHNQDEIDRLDVRIGDTVILERAGDVIPDVVGVLPKLRTGQEKKYQMPDKCPICQSKVIRPKGEVAYYCTNKKCFAQERRKMIHFVSKSAFDIDGLGEKIIEQLIHEGLISNPADLFKLKQGDLEPLERFAEKSAANIIASIEKSKEIDLSRFIYALAIRHVGEESALDLANSFGHLEKLKKALIDDLEEVKDIGPIIAQSIYDWFHKKENLKLLDKLEKFVRIKKPMKGAIHELPLRGLSFVLTGTLAAMTRDETKEKIRQLGGDISSSVSKETDYVVVGKEPGSKYEKAKKFDIKILKEKEFLRFIKKRG